MGKNSALYTATQWVTVTPSDDDDLPAGIRAIYANSAGDIAAVGQDDHLEVFTVAAGQVLLIQPKRINATDTTVISMLAMT